MGGCAKFWSNQILVELNRIGLVKLREILKKADESGLADQDAIVDHIMELVSAENYLPESQIEGYRKALWREFKRYKKEDFSDYYSEIEVVVRGEPGDDLDRFLATLVSVFGDFELKPVVTIEPPEGNGQYPQLLLEDEPVIKGCIPREAFKRTVRRHITHW
ncbi:hypothetical protein ACFLU6_04065 [Acidobacteriota bacterium]